MIIWFFPALKLTDLVAKNKTKQSKNTAVNFISNLSNFCFLEGSEIAETSHQFVLYLLDSRKQNWTSRDPVQ